MSIQLVTMRASNATVLCVGGITEVEAENARADGQVIDGFGYYLFLADEGEPTKPIQLLAKFFSPSEAEAFARVIRHSGYGVAH